MSVANIGVRSGNTIVPYQSTTKRTKVLELVKTTDINATGTTLGTYLITRCVAVFYADSTGKWRMKCNGYLTCDAASRSQITITFANVVFKSAPAAIWPISSTAYAGGYLQVISSSAAANTGNVLIIHGAASSTEYGWSFDIELNAEPTTYTTAANMEGVLAADVYIAPASATAAGLLSAYAEGTYQPTISNQTNCETGTPAAFTLRYQRVGNVVTVFGQLSGDFINAANTTVSFDMTLPIASTLANTYDVAGLLGGGATTQNITPFSITRQSASTVRVSGSSTTGANTTVWSLFFMYQVL